MKEQLIVVSPDAGRIKEILPKRRFGTGNSFKKDETAENARVALLVAGDCIFLRNWFFVNFGERCIFVLILMNESNPVYSQ